MYVSVLQYVSTQLVQSIWLPQWRVVLVGPLCLPLGSAYQGGGDVR